MTQNIKITQQSRFRNKESLTNSVLDHCSRVIMTDRDYSRSTHSSCKHLIQLSSFIFSGITPQLAPAAGAVALADFCMFGRVHLVCPLLACLSHFHAPDWFKLNCPSFSYHIHPQRHSEAHERSDCRHIQLYMCSFVSTRDSNNILFVKRQENAPTFRSKFALMRVIWQVTWLVILTVKWANAGRWRHQLQCQRSGFYSSRCGRDRQRS